MPVQWAAEEASEFVTCCLDVMSLKAYKDLEMRARAGTGTEDYFNADAKDGNACCASERDNGGGNNHASPSQAPCCANSVRANTADSQGIRYRFKKNPEDSVGETLDDLMDPYSLRKWSGAIAEKAGSVYQNVTRKAQEAGAMASAAELPSIREEILREAVIRTVLNALCRRRLKDHSSDAKAGGLLASPLGYTKHPLEFLRNETLEALMYRGWAVQDNFLGEQMRERIYNDVTLLEFDGQFREAKDPTLGASKPAQQERTCWIDRSHLDRETHRGLWALTDHLSALPYELNKKARLMCQVARLFQLSVFPATGTYSKVHRDGGFTALTDTGRKITVMYFPNRPDWQEEHGGFMRIHAPVSQKKQRDEEQKTQMRELQPQRGKTGPKGTSAPDPEANDKQAIADTVAPKGDRLILFKSRLIPYEVLPTYQKRFAVTLWISGPPDAEE